MADIFVSYAKADREWASWIGEKLTHLGHVPHIADWEVEQGTNISAWAEEHLSTADLVLVVVSKNYLASPSSSIEVKSAIRHETKARVDSIRPVFVEAVEAPTLLAQFKRCEIFGISEKDAEARLTAFVGPTGKPPRRPSFPGSSAPIADTLATRLDFPGNTQGLSNVPISVPRYFLGRDHHLAAIDRALKSDQEHVAAVALHGLRGVGKTTLAAAYAERQLGDYRATWWIKAETEATMRADLVGLGVRLQWVAADEKEEFAVAAVLEQLRYDGEGILLIYDNAISVDELRRYLPRSGAARVIVTSNSPNWREIAVPLEIRIWPNEIGADYLIARSGRSTERDAALALSEALGGLPLAHEQAAAYCERLGISLADYLTRFGAMPVSLLDTGRDAPADYYDHMTVAKTFSLAIDEAAKLHPAVEQLIVYAALLAPEPIPLFLFSEAREHFGEPLASSLAGDGLDEAVAVLRAFALIDRESIADERDPSITTDCIRLHRLVRQVAAARRTEEELEAERRKLVEVMVAVYPGGVFNDPKTWPQARRLDALAVALVANDVPLPEGADTVQSVLLNRLAAYRQGPLAAYAVAQPLLERALAIREKTLGPDHPGTARSLNNLGAVLQAQGDLEGARTLFERALAINEKVLGPESTHTATALNNLAALLYESGDYQGARSLFERALAINEKVLGPDDIDVAMGFNNLGGLLRILGDLEGARQFSERALKICEQVLGPHHPYTATSLNNLAIVLQMQNNLDEARRLFERALAIDEKALGPEHPETATDISNLAELVAVQGKLTEAQLLYERALTIREKVLGSTHRSTQASAYANATLLNSLGRIEEAAALRERYRIGDQDTT